MPYRHAGSSIARLRFVESEEPCGRGPAEVGPSLSSALTSAPHLFRAGLQSVCVLGARDGNDDRKISLSFHKHIIQLKTKPISAETTQEVVETQNDTMLKNLNNSISEGGHVLTKLYGWCGRCWIEK
jgi:hypothetical protein